MKTVYLHLHLGEKDLKVFFFNSSISHLENCQDFAICYLKFAQYQYTSTEQEKTWLWIQNCFRYSHEASSHIFSFKSNILLFEVIIISACYYLSISLVHPQSVINCCKFCNFQKDVNWAVIVYLIYVLMVSFIICGVLSYLFSLFCKSIQGWFHITHVWFLFHTTSLQSNLMRMTSPRIISLHFT